MTISCIPSYVYVLKDTLSLQQFFSVIELALSLSLSLLSAAEA